MPRLLCQSFDLLPFVEHFETWTNALVTCKLALSQRLVADGSDHFLPHLSEAFIWATQVDLAVALSCDDRTAASAA